MSEDGFHGEAFDFVVTRAVGSGGFADDGFGSGLVLREPAGGDDERAAEDGGRAGDEFFLRLQFGGANIEAFGEAVGALPGLGGIDAATVFAGFFRGAEFVGLVVPIIDFAGEALVNLLHGFADMLLATRGNGCEVFGNEVLDGVTGGAFFKAVHEPGSVHERFERFQLSGCGRDAIEVGRVASAGGAAGFIEVNEIEAARDRGGAASGVFGFGVGDGVFEIEKDAGGGAFVERINEHGALAEKVTVALEDEVNGGIEKRVAGREQGGGGLTVDAHGLLVKGDAFVGTEHGGAQAGDAVALADVGGNVANFVAPGFALGELAAETREGFLKKGADVVGLEAAGLGAFHFLAYGLHAAEWEIVLGELAFIEEFAKACGVEVVPDDAFEAGAGFGSVVLADGVDEEFLERLALENFAEHVEHGVGTEGFALFFEFAEEAVKDFAFAGVLGDEVPEVALVALADAVDAAETLFEAVGVPGEVVVDHEVRALEVDAFAGGIGGDEDGDGGVAGEGFLDFAAVFTRGLAVDGNDGVRVAEEGGELAGEVVEGIALLGEDDEFAAVA